MLDEIVRRVFGAHEDFEQGIDVLDVAGYVARVAAQAARQREFEDQESLHTRSRDGRRIAWREDELHEAVLERLQVEQNLLGACLRNRAAFDDGLREFGEHEAARRKLLSFEARGTEDDEDSPDDLVASTPDILPLLDAFPHRSDNRVECPRKLRHIRTLRANKLRLLPGTARHCRKARLDGELELAEDGEEGSGGR